MTRIFRLVVARPELAKVSYILNRKGEGDENGCYRLKRQELNTAAVETVLKKELAEVDTALADRMQLCLLPLWRDPHLQSAEDHLNPYGANYWLEMQAPNGCARSAECYAGTRAACICEELEGLMDGCFNPSSQATGHGGAVLR